MIPLNVIDELKIYSNGSIELLTSPKFNYKDGIKKIEEILLLDIDEKTVQLNGGRF